MKTKLLFLLATVLAAGNVNGQDIKTKDVPVAVKSALAKKYPEAAKVTWEKEKGNYEANWGGKSGEDTAVQFTPSGAFVEIVNAIAVTELPENIAPYVKQHYKGVKTMEAGRVTNANNVTMYEVEIRGKDLIFDKDGHFLKKD